MNKTKRKQADLLFLLLAALFIAALVTCNLIANKFVEVDLGFKVFVISAGVLPYPITFLITDILSEIYGKKRTSMVVFMGLAASVFTLGILWLGHQFPAITDSPVSSEEYANVFQNSKRVVFASMVAYLFAQLIDVRLFHFWKKLTKGKHLWLRNNASTILSQLVDTTLVVFVLFYDRYTWDQMGNLITDGWQFKVLVALIDTAFFYLLVIALRKFFRLKRGEELSY